MPNSNTIQIPLTRGFISTIDESDADLAEVKWHVWSNGRIQYAVRSSPTINGNRHDIYLHRVVLERVIGRTLIGKEIPDHIDGNGLNNCRINLRPATRSQNGANRGISKNNKSGYKGVFWQASHKKWRAEIRVLDKQLFLGLYDTPEEAAMAYIEAARYHFGEFARFE